MSFDGQVAVVTGGTRGIGAAITQRLLAAGVAVTAVFASDTDGAQRFAASMATQPGELTLRRADVADADACREVVAETVRAHGHLDHLVSNVGLLIEGPVRLMSVDDWDRALAVNLSASFHLAKAALEPMVQRRSGRIVVISSVTAVLGSPVEIGYGAAKAGLHGLSRSLARAVARKGVTVNVVVPGVFETAMTNAMDAKDQAAIKAMIPMGRRGDPDELAHAVMFLLDERAGYVTGSVVTVDGGLSMGG